MTEEESARLTKDDIERVSSKLESMMEELPEQERNVLGLILTRAATASESEVEGFSFSPALSGGAFGGAFAGQLAQSAGFHRPIAGTVTVSWGYHIK
jgi:hypothetical protein